MTSYKIKFECHTVRSVAAIYILPYRSQPLLARFDGRVEARQCNFLEAIKTTTISLHDGNSY